MRRMVSTVGMFLVNVWDVAQSIAYFAVISLTYWEISRWAWSTKRAELIASHNAPGVRRCGTSRDDRDDSESRYPASRSKIGSGGSLHTDAGERSECSR